jgi:hypothetical protein
MMASEFLNPRQNANGKAGQVEEAKKMQKATRDAALNDGVDEPPYEFLELIGKGTFGRVYKRLAILTCYHHQILTSVKAKIVKLSNLWP